MTKLISKKQEIKKRIELINKGEVPKGYKKSSTKVFPKDWNEEKLENLCIKRTKTVRNRVLETLSISAGIGFVNQAQKFGRELSGKQYEHYIIINKGDFAYNKGNSKKYPQGCVYLLEDREVAAVPNVFNTFKLKTNCINGYYKQLFQIGYLNQQLHKYINFGVRNDGLLNLYDSDFYSVLLPCPKLKEQEKIAEILCCCDKVIELKEKLLNEENNEKKYLMQILLKESSYSNSCKLGDLCDITTGKLDANAQVVNGKYRFYTCAAEYCYIDEYAFDTEALLISGNGANVGYIHYYKGKFNAYQRTYVLDNFKCNIHYIKYRLDYLLNQIISREKNAGNTPYIVLPTLQNINIYLPKNISKQTKIVNILSGKDKEIELLKQELEQYKQLKKSLSQLLLTGIVRVNEV